MRRWQWQQAAGRRHAYDAHAHTPEAGVPLPTLCGIDAVPSTYDITGKWLERTCWSCDREIREREGFPLDEIPPLPDTPTPRSPDGTACTARPPRPRDRR